MTPSCRIPSKFSIDGGRVKSMSRALLGTAVSLVLGQPRSESFGSGFSRFSGSLAPINRPSCVARFGGGRCGRDGWGVIVQLYTSYETNGHLDAERPRDHIRG